MSTVTKRPQLNSDDLLRLKWLLGNLLALLAAWTVFFIDIDAWLLLTLITLVAGAGLVRPEWPARVPAWMHRLAFPTMLAVFAADIYTTREPLPALIRLGLLLILYRLTTHRQRRDDLQLIVLGLFLIVVAGVLTVSLAFAAQILAFTGCALLFLFVLTLADNVGSTAAVDPAPTTWTRGRWSDLFRRLLAATDWRIAALGALLFGGLVAISGLLFLALPRFELQNNLFLDRLINRRSQSGFSDTVQFGEITEISTDNSLAMTVDVEPSAVPPVPYWRMVVLDDYTGSGFSMSAQLRQQLLRARMNRGTTGTASPRPGAAEWTIYLQPGVTRYMPLVGEFVSLQFNEPQTFGEDRRAGIVALRRDPPKMVALRVRGMEAADRRPARREPASEREPALNLELVRPADQARLRQIVREIEGENAGSDAAGFAQRAGAWLELRHRYSLRSAVPPGEGDLLVRWLDSTAPGHCEFFAGSLVLLARAAGYPARLVTGFKGGNWNGYSNSLAVRNANAHAWCELYDAATATWLRADPTPGAEAAAQLADESGAAGRLQRFIETGWRARMESLQVFWYRRIVDFDRSSQRELVTTTRQAVASLATDVRRWLDGRAESLRRWLNQPWDFSRLTLVLALPAGAALLFWGWRRVGRGRWLRWRSRRVRPRRDPVRREAGRWLLRLPAAAAEDDAQLEQVRRELLRLRYGPTASWPDAPAVFRRAHRAIRLQRKQKRVEGGDATSS